MCNKGAGNPAYLLASGASTYTWSPSNTLNNYLIPNPQAQPLVTTTYTVIGTAANSCTNSAVITVSVQPPAFTLGPDLLVCQNSTLTLGSGIYNSNQYVYTWYQVNANGTTGPVIGSSSTLTLTASWVPSVAGRTFRLCIRHIASDCMFCDDIIIRTKTSPCAKPLRLASQNLELLSFEVFPNPNSGTFYVKLDEFDEKPININVYNQLGQLVFTQKVGLLNENNSFEIELKNIDSGIYYVHLISDSAGIFGTQKILIQR